MKVKDQGDVKVTRTACMLMCGSQCGLLAHVRNGRLTKVEPADFPETKYRFACHKGLSTPRLVNHPDRLKYPLKRVGERGEGKWQRISWDEALDTIAAKFKDIATNYGPESVAYLMGGLSFPGGGLFSGQRFASASGATFVDVVGSGDAAQPGADMLSFGTRWAGSYLLEHDDPRLCVYWGDNITETGAWKYRHFREAREKGAKMVVIDPLFTATAAKADEYIPVRPGTDAALVLGMIKVILDEGLCNESFLIDYTVGPFLVRSDNGLFLKAENASSGDSPGKYVSIFLKAENAPSGESSGKYIIWDIKTNQPKPYDTPGVAPALRGSYIVEGIEYKPAFQMLAELAEQYPLGRASEITEVAPDVIRRLALDHANLKPVVTDIGMGIQRAFHGDLSYRAITTLAAVTGNINVNRPEEDVLTTLNWMAFLAPGGRFFKPLPIMLLYDAALMGNPYAIKAMWVSSHNPANSAANRKKFKEVISHMEFIVAVELFMSATAEYADIVLPGCTPFESTNMSLPFSLFNGGHPYLQLQPKVIEPLYESKSDMEIFTLLASRMGIREFFDKSAEEYIEMFLSSGHPSMEGVTLEKLREGPMRVKPHPLPTFETPSGRLEFYVERMKEFGQELPVYIEPPESVRQPLAQKYPLCLLSTHAKFRQHSTFANVDWLRELDPEPTLDMSPVDAEKSGIRDGDMVVVFNDRGRVGVKARIHEGMKPGVVNITEGWWPRDFADGSFQELTHNTINPAHQAAFQPNASFYDTLVAVKKD